MLGKVKLGEVFIPVMNFGVCDFSRFAVTDWRLWRWRLCFLALMAATQNKIPVSGSSIPVSGVKLKRGSYVYWLFFNIDLRSARSMESSRRDFLRDVAEHRSVLKTDQNTYHSRFSFMPTGVLFLLCIGSFARKGIKGFSAKC